MEHNGNKTKIKQVSCLQLNMRKAYAAATELNRKLSKMGDYIAFITEPCVSRGKIVSLPPRCQKIAVSEAPRAAILANKRINIAMVEQLCNRDCAVGIARLKNRLTLLVSVYLDIQENVCPEWLQQVVDYSSCLLYTSPSPRDKRQSRMPSSA